MKIAIVIPTLTLGGAEKVALETANELDRIGHNVHVIVMSNKVILTASPNVTIHEGVDGFFQLAKALKLLKIDYCISYMERANLFSSVACKIIGITHCATVHTAPIAGFKMRSRKNRIAISFTYRLLRFLNTKVVGVSRGIIDDLNKLYGIKNSYVVPNFIDVNEIEQFSKEKEQIEAYDYVFVGRLSKIKGCHVLIEALANIKAQGKINKIRVAVVGDGPEYNQISQLITQYGLQKNVHLIGARINPYPYMLNAAAIIVPSFAEGFGMVVLEALSLGRKVIFSRCDFGPKEIIDTNFAEFSHLGFKNPSDDLAASISELATILVNEVENKTVYDKSFVRFKVEANYNKQIICKLLLDVLER
uniref:Alpha-N-acetylgalactosaminyltransferase n=1 Tax=Enterobacter cloacae TaxID=550 RepID=A0A6B9XUK8_ENTCL|nr:alpha-N-acetylgalactosaminyltransferase [Enterobacter cloacae]